MIIWDFHLQQVNPAPTAGLPLLAWGEAASWWRTLELGFYDYLRGARCFEPQPGVCVRLLRCPSPAACLWKLGCYQLSFRRR